MIAVRSRNFPFESVSEIPSSFIFDAPVVVIEMSIRLNEVPASSELVNEFCRATLYAARSENEIPSCEATPIFFMISVMKSVISYFPTPTALAKTLVISAASPARSWYAPNTLIIELVASAMLIDPATASSAASGIVSIMVW